MKKLKTFALYIAFFAVPIAFWGQFIYVSDFTISNHAAAAIEEQLGQSWSSFQKEYIVLVNEKPYLILGARHSYLSRLQLSVQSNPGSRIVASNRTKLSVKWLKRQQLQLIQPIDAGYGKLRNDFL